MYSLFHRLPGEIVALKDIQSVLKEMWDMNLEGGKLCSQRPDFRAMQMNLILHLGTKLQLEDALNSFSQAIDFSCLHPCRILVLCPCAKGNENLLLQAKLFSQCYIGRGTKNMSCCDAIILNYSEDESGLLEHQVSIWLDNDLPSYHWIRGLEASKIEREYCNCLSLANKIVYDSALEGLGYQSLRWPEGIQVEDFCFLRTLPLRQALGFHLSGYKPKLLVEDLTAVELHSSPALQAEAAYLLDWVKTSLKACQALAASATTVSYTHQATLSTPGLHLEFSYARDAYFRFSYDPESGQSLIETKLEESPSSQPLQIYKLSPEQVLTKAIFG